MMFKKKSKDAVEEETSEKSSKNNKNKAKKPKLTPHEKALKNKIKVERAASAKVKRAEAKVKKAEQAIKNKEKAAAKKIKDQEKKIANKRKREEQNIEKKEHKKEQKIANKLKNQEDKAKQKAEKMQKKAELAARSPLQKKIDRRLKTKKFMAILLIIIALTGLLFAGIKFGPKLLAKMNLPEVHFSQVTEGIKSKIPFLNKEKSEKETEKKNDEKSKTSAEEGEKAKDTGAKDSNTDSIEDEKTLYISGSSVLENYYSSALKKFLGLNKKETKEHSIVASTNDAYTNLINGDQQVIFSSFPTDKETKMAELAGVNLQPIPILNGGLVFFINKDNPVKNLTMTQLYNIYSGTITNWKDLGGKDEPITAFQHTENSGSQLGIYKYVINENEIMKVEDELKIASTKDIIKEVSKNKAAIGFSYYYYMTKKNNSDDVKMISVNSVKPDKKTIENAEYPLTTYTYAIVTTEENTKSLSDVIASVDDKISSMRVADAELNEENADSKQATDAAIKEEPLPLKLEFVKWILSDEGQKMAEENGFIRHNNK